MTWLVDVYGYDTVEIEAQSRGKARYAAFRKFRAAYPCSFLDFLARGVTVRLEPRG